ncbi:MAG: hypothetical protein JNK48_03925 [Bryobacterales bacterium]|nr:hypothetical protein [Bryobacterales bacterium]
MPQYLLLLHESSTAAAGISPGEMEAIIKRYGAWSANVAAKGHMRGGNKLQDGTGRVMQVSAGRLSVTDGPYAESKEVLGGYFLIEASDYDEAVRVAGDCPHLDFGKIEIREIEPTE